MTLEQTLVQKLKPHADRVSNGQHSDFDYLPAVLFQSLEHSKQLNNSLTNHFESTVASFDKQNQAIATLHASQDKLLAANIASIFKEITENQKTQEKQTQQNHIQILEDLDFEKKQQMEVLNAGFAQQNQLQGELKTFLSQVHQRYEVSLKASDEQRINDFRVLKKDLMTQKIMSYALGGFSLLSLILTVLMFFKK